MSYEKKTLLYSVRRALSLHALLTLYLVRPLYSGLLPVSSARGSAWRYFVVGMCILGYILDRRLEDLPCLMLPIYRRILCYFLDRPLEDLPCIMLLICRCILGFFLYRPLEDLPGVILLLACVFWVISWIVD